MSNVLNVLKTPLDKYRLKCTLTRLTWLFNIYLNSLIVINKWFWHCRKEIKYLSLYISIQLYNADLEKCNEKFVFDKRCFDSVKNVFHFYNRETVFVIGTRESLFNRVTQCIFFVSWIFANDVHVILSPFVSSEISPSLMFCSMPAFDRKSIIVL